MHSFMGIVFAGTVFVVCIQWPCISASSLSSGNNTLPLANASSDTVNFPCDNTTAECACRSGYEGPNCTQCQSGYYHRSNSSTECAPCKCNEEGSLNKDCDGFATCSCKPGVGGRRCNQCLSNYYGFSTSGCQQCNCEKIAIECLYVSKYRLSKDSTLSAMCDSCLLNTTWVHQCRKSRCQFSEYLLSNGSCVPCQCSPGLRVSNGSRHCDLMTGKCPKCEGESCRKGVPGHFQYKVYIIASGSVAGVVIIILIILLAVYCRRRWRRQSRHTPLPLWTIELRHGNGDAGDDATHELAFDDSDIMYLDDSYLMESSSDYFTESTDSVNGRAGYHTLS